MTREETKKCIEVMQYFEDGGEVQILVYDYDGRQEWEVFPNPDWNWDYHTYRKKPQPLKVTEEEKEIISKTLIWVKSKVTGNVGYYDSVALDTCRAKFLILNSETMEWEDWNEDADALKHFYNGGQP